MPQAIFITGAARGIGAATARRFAERGWFVGLTDVDEAGLAEQAARIGHNRCWHAALDVREIDRFRACVGDFANASGGRMDVLFNNAGILRIERFEAIAPEEAARIVDVNVKGVINGVYAALPVLKATQGARIISMCSASAIYGTPDFAVYSSTKFAVRALTEALDIELAEHGIKVSDIMPSFVDTEMVSGQATRPPSIDRLGIKLTADDIAEWVWKAAHGNQIHYIPNPQNRPLFALSGFTRMARPMIRALMKR